MVHPATQRVARAAIVALNAPLDIGMVFPPKPGEDRGYGVWTNRDLGLDEILSMLPRASAANARGGAIYMRLGPSSRNAHPGIVMLDDLTGAAVGQLSRDGVEPCLVVQTSLGNYQAWVRLIAEGTVDYGVVTQVVRHLAQVYGGDERAVSPRQPGRLPGFVNGKAKHRLADGRFPFVRLTEACPGRVASSGADLIHRVSSCDTGRAARGALPETPRDAASAETLPRKGIVAWLDAAYQQHLARIEREVAEGRRSTAAASQSEVDFATARAAIAAGLDLDTVVNWLAVQRPEKARDYAERTVDAAISWPDRSRPDGLRR